jgi:hypothetical protein
MRSSTRRLGRNPSGDLILEVSLVSVQDFFLAITLDFIVAFAGTQVKSPRRSQVAASSTASRRRLAEQ